MNKERTIEAIKNAIQTEISALHDKRAGFAKSLYMNRTGFTDDLHDLSLRIGVASAKIKQWVFILEHLDSMKLDDYIEDYLATLMARRLGFGFGVHSHTDSSVQLIPVIDKVEMLNTFMQMLSWSLGDTVEDQLKKSKMKGIARAIGFNLCI